MFKQIFRQPYPIWSIFHEESDFEVPRAQQTKTLTPKVRKLYKIEYKILIKNHYWKHCEFIWFSATFAKRKYLNFKMMLRWSQRCQNGSKNGAKMPPRWLLDAPVGVKMALRSATREHLGHILAPRWPTWRTFGSILATFVKSWARSCRKLRKPKK